MDPTKVLAILTTDLELPADPGPVLVEAAPHRIQVEPDTGAFAGFGIGA